MGIVTIAFSLFAFGLFGLLDMVTLSDDVIGRVWFLRYAVVCPAVVLVAALTFLPGWRRFGQFAITAICALAGLVPCAEAGIRQTSRAPWPFAAR